MKPLKGLAILTQNFEWGVRTQNCQLCEQINKISRFRNGEFELSSIFTALGGDRPPKAFWFILR